ncbi:MAG: MFS transporter [Deltaproteobacteria bacterium]|nr:MFS transporter [Deltaproteobacteria bacterium]MBW2301098.1 MFS transporter [Deltaproteobacteria bacterium]
MNLPQTRPSSRIFYGWYVLGASFLILFVSSGAAFSFGVMFKPMIADLGWSRSAISSAFFLNMSVYAFSLIITGKLYDRYGPKWVIVFSTICFSAGYVSIATVNSLSQFLLFYGVISAAGLGGTTIPIFAALVSKWFEKSRGLAISLALSGACLGQFVLVPLFTTFVLRYGWRKSYVWIGLITLVVNIVLALTVLRADPDELGIKPYGWKDSGQQDVKPGSSQHGEVRDLNFSQAIRTPSFWLFLVVMFICGSGDFLVTTHLVPMVTDYGISPSTGGHMLAWFGLMALPGILLAGPASDLIGTKIPIALTFTLRVALFLMVLKYHSAVSFYIFSLLFGLTFLVTAPLTPVLVGRLYGLSYVGILSGFITTIHHLGGGFWAYMGGVIFDKTGSYSLAFSISAVMALAAVIGMLLIKEERHAPERDWRV